MADWYYAADGEKKGPLKEVTLLQLFAKGKIPRDAWVWCEGMAEWAPALQQEPFASRVPAAASAPPIPRRSVVAAPPARLGRRRAPSRPRRRLPIFSSLFGGFFLLIGWHVFLSPLPPALVATPELPPQALTISEYLARPPKTSDLILRGGYFDYHHAIHFKDSLQFRLLFNWNNTDKALYIPLDEDPPTGSSQPVPRIIAEFDGDTGSQIKQIRSDALAVRTGGSLPIEIQLNYSQTFGDQFNPKIVVYREPSSSAPVDLTPEQRMKIHKGAGIFYMGLGLLFLLRAVFIFSRR